MDLKEQQLKTLLGLTTRTLTDLTASITSMSFELLRSDDSTTRNAARQMIDRMMTISSNLDEHWRLLAEFSGQASEAPIDGMTPIARQDDSPRLPSN
ncbi:hypothetical protein IF690_23375 [Pseudomonas sp. SK3(2021)]|uniref:hypothetical protein n=1 Tax=Pseudomonas sp. SK3(2021) TaxID=2841064 RepID=UPI00192B48A7|nr:hypothetical protein [Pseudomonas sp. SK3(2021)]QQZ44868.1 hypothetical protein IF690_23375 [Pseudomonas sp. SK3(2021)]